MPASGAHRIAVIAGDGIGHEVMPAAIDVAEAVAGRFGFSLDWAEYPWSCETYLKTGAMMPSDGIDTLANHDAILLGAVGYPSVPDHVSLWGLLIPIRRAFDQYVNLRPALLFPGVPSPLRDTEAGIDILIVRENTEGEYSEVGGRVFAGTPHEFAVQEAVFTRRGIERVVDYAARLAESRSGRLTSATKSNGIIHTMTMWDDVAAQVVARHGGVEYRSMHVDALAARFISHPGELDVIVGSNLFGDILSDVGAAIVGSLGMAPSANLNPERDHPSMFEPVHGSAPDIAGAGVANPIAQIWSAAMMLDHLGHPGAADAIIEAIRHVLAETDVRTPDLGGNARTSDVAAAIVDAVKSVHKNETVS
ncbi:tartrate dehydrogenase [Mycolicibacterium sp. BiH015]|uniref:tartrate dehydrogenase n=1 Tax=Mycolicibacterium sp. BiH015 TaxID=3018808 RepID=UPI0022E395DB|nr:tartrate dehydrogenase [Mycolicibacterium sp. BiH015]MDA2889440.1 tartrate dehydrogenase [Mycolicibacterium sp. BiH015]